MSRSPHTRLLDPAGEPAKPRWSTPADIETVVRRRWASGELLTAYAAAAPFETISVPLRGPSPSQIGDDLAGVQGWVAALESGAGAGTRQRYTLERRPVGGRVVGRNLIPARAVVSTYDQAWALLGVRAAITAYDEILDRTTGVPAIRDWVAVHPMRALKAADDWPDLLAAYQWLDRNRGLGRYLREISAPGVDTKFVERHRRTLGELLGLSGPVAGFTAGLGFRDKPPTVRVRFNAEFLGLPPTMSEATFRLEELSRVQVAVQSALIVENEITYLSVPVPAEGLVVFGEGFRVSRPGALPWLRDAAVRYWGDLDTHGFAILHQLRAWLPQTESLLMDRETLLVHQDRWGTEPTPTAAVLDRLTDVEQAVYADLVTGQYGDRVRLEQERIDWAWVQSHWPE